jgi:Na+-driven multidrug efflux pump
MILLTVGLLIIYPFAPFFVSLFSKDPSVIAEGALYLRIEGLAIFTYALIGIASSVLQAIKKPYFALIIGVGRQLFPFLVFSLLGEIFGLGVSGIWWGIVIINYVAVIVVWSITHVLLKKAKATAVASEVIYE